MYNSLRTTPGAAWAASGASGAPVVVPPTIPHVLDFCEMILAGKSIGMSRWSPQHLAVEADVDPGNHSGWAAGGGVREAAPASLTPSAHNGSGEWTSRSKCPASTVRRTSYDLRTSQRH